MITIQNIIDAINSLLLTKYPACTYYIEDIPSGFDRPSFYIQMVTDSSTSANRATTREKPSFQVVYFGNVNEYQATSMEERLSVYQEVKNLCKTGHIVVNGKALKLSEGGFQGEIRDNEVFCTLDFEYFEERPGIADSNPVATDIQINQKEV